MRDFDYHPDEPTVRCFGVPPSGVIHDDERRCVYQVREADVVLRHYAFADEWFKLNVTFDRDGRLIETGAASFPYAANCDIATPMTRTGDDISAVDLFLDVLVRADGRSSTVTDRREFAQACSTGLISPAEAEAARLALDRLSSWIGSGRLWALVTELDPTVAGQAPPPLPFRRVPVDEVPSVMPGRRPTWG